MKGGLGLENEITCAVADAKKAQMLVGRVCRESKKTRTEMITTLGRIAQAVHACSSKLLDEQGNAGRYLMVCRMLECLEDEKRKLDSDLVTYFHLDDSFTRSTIYCLKWEGEWASATRETAEITAVSQRVQKALARLENEKRMYADSRDRLGVLSREILPQFLKEVYRLSDADHNGKGLRAQSVCVRCGELSRHISAEFHK